MLKRIYFYIIIILVIITAFSIFANMNIMRKHQKQNDEYTMFKERFDEMKKELEIYKELAYYKDVLSDIDYSYLQKKGLKEPIKEIKENLMSKPEIIGIKGIKGGKIDFYDSRNIYILNSKWVYAFFEDGHIAGSVLFEYTINKGKIKWQVIKVITE